MEIEENQHISQEERIQAAFLMRSRKENNRTVEQISQQTGISRRWLYALEKKYEDDCLMRDYERSGRPGKIDKAAERRICRLIKKNPFEVSSNLTRDYNLGMEEEEKISTSSFKKVAQGHDLKARRPCSKPFLTESHIADRLAFANYYRDKDMRFWSRVLFCDETSLQLHPKDMRQRVRRSSGERYSKEYLLPAFKHGDGSLMFWGCISWKGQGTLKLIKGRIKGSTYNTLLTEAIPETFEDLDIRSAWLLEDNATPHGTKDVINTKANLKLKKLLDYPANSPDLNPLESLWSYWKTKVKNREPSSLEELEVYAYEEWEKIPLDLIRNYIKSMPNRLSAIIANEGQHTKY